MTALKIAPWQERAAVARRDAAAIFEKPTRWIDHQVEAGRLLSYQTRPGGPRMICVQSILELLAGSLLTIPLPSRPVAHFGKPRLVWRHPTL